MYNLAKKFLFMLEPETAHNWAKSFGAILSSFGFLKVKNPVLKTKIGEMNLDNPLGLAAGFDKNGEAFSFAKNLGFGFSEIGSVTYKPCEGNAHPRLFRLPKDESLINRLGLPNWGAEKIAAQLHKTKHKLHYGINIAKTPGAKDAVEDFIFTFRAMHSFGGYTVINLSCPNTEDGRTFEDSDALVSLLSAFEKERKALKFSKPFLIKMSPDTEGHTLKKNIEIACKYNVDGFVLTNTSTTRENLATDLFTVKKIGRGGLSGKAVFHKSNEVIKKVYNLVSTEKIIIGLGGILSVEDLLVKLALGASYFQVYTGLVYKGPFFIKNLLQGLVSFCKKNGVKHYQELVGQKEILKMLKPALSDDGVTRK